MERKNIQKYELSQNGRRYILATEVKDQAVKLTCYETEVPNPRYFVGKYTLEQLRQLSSIFESMSSIVEAQDLLNRTVEKQKVSVEPLGNLINIIMYLSKESETDESFFIKMGLSSKGVIYNQPLVFHSVVQGPSSPTKHLPPKVYSTKSESVEKTVYSPIQKLPEVHVTLPPEKTITAKEIYDNTKSYPNLQKNDEKYKSFSQEILENVENYKNEGTVDSYQNLFNLDSNKNVETVDNYQDLVNLDTYTNTETVDNYKNVETYDNYQNLFNLDSNKNVETVDNYQNLVNLDTKKNTETFDNYQNLETVGSYQNLVNSKTTETVDYQNLNLDNYTNVETVGNYTTFETKKDNSLNLDNIDNFKNLQTTDIYQNAENYQNLVTNDNILNLENLDNYKNLDTNDIYQNLGNTDKNVETYENYEYQSSDNYQNYENLLNTDIKVETQINKTTPVKTEQKLTFSLRPSDIFNKSKQKNQNTNFSQIFNEYKTSTLSKTQYQPKTPQTNYEYELPYISPAVDDINITTTSSKLLQSKNQYTVPVNPSASKFSFSTSLSRNPNYQQKIEKTKTTTTQLYPGQQVPNSQINIYKNKITQLENETNRLRVENENLKNQSNKFNGELSQLRNRVQILLQENKSLREKSGTSPSLAQIQEVSILKQENAKLKRQVEINNGVQITFEQYKLLKEEEIKYLKMQIEELSKNQKKLEEIISLKQKEINELKRQNQNLSENQYSANSQTLNNALSTDAIQDTHLQIVKGDIIKSSEELELLTRKICQDSKKVTLDLLYKASIDSDRATAFHNKCDGANRTLVLIKSGNEKRFGGYTTCSWKGDSIEKKDENAFVFSLDKMKIYDIIPGEDAIGCYPKYGPVFLGCQIRIYDEFLKKGGTTFEKGINYNTQEDYELSGGLKKFDVKEIEVYSVQLE